MQNKILGIDHSYSGTGWYFDENNFGLIETTAKMHHLARIIFISEKLNEIIEKFKPDTIILGDYSIGSKYWSEQMGELSGQIRILIYQKKIPCYKIPPKTMKKYITGNGNSNKFAIMKTLREKFNINFSDNNIADAYGLWKMGRELDYKELSKYDLHKIKKD